MLYNFDEIINRTNTHSYKYDLRDKIFGNKDVTPLWVADMDFKVAPEILADINNRVNHGIFGYTFHYSGLYKSLCNWLNIRHNWIVDENSIILTHGVVPSINIAINAFTEPGDKIIVQPPVYYPMFQSVTNNNRQVVFNQLIYKNGEYTIDFEDLEKQIDDKVKMLLLCHPHNPVGRAWTRDELTQLSCICLKNNIIVVSDEIHSDIIFPVNKHIPYATISESAAANSITLVAPSKTFNIAGLAISAIIASDKKLLSGIKHIINQLQLHGINLLGLNAFESAYCNGGIWLDQLLLYLQKNIDFIDDFIKQKLPFISFKKPEATYLAWLNFRQLGKSDDQIKDILINKAGVGLSEGKMFGAGGEGFQRLNFACPLKVIEESMDRIAKSFL